MTEAAGEVVALVEATSPGLPPGTSEAEAAQIAHATERAQGEPAALLQPVAPRQGGAVDHRRRADGDPRHVRVGPGDLDDRAVVHQLERHRRRRRHPLRRLPQLLGDLHGLREGLLRARRSTTASSSCSCSSCPTAFGIVLAYLLDKNLRGGRHLPEHLLHARRALARRRRVHLEERDVLAGAGAVLDDPRSHRPGEPDRLARRPVPPDLVRQHVRRSPRTSSRSSSRSPGDTPATSWCSTSPA